MVDVTPAESLMRYLEYTLLWCHVEDKVRERIGYYGRVETPTEVLARENWWDRGCFQNFADPSYGNLTLQMPVWRMTETPPRIRWACRPSGYHNGYIYQKYLGLGPRHLAELHTQGVL